MVCAIVLSVATLTIRPWPAGVFEDDGAYTVLAKALASGDGYRMLNLPGAPHATHFPPGYPLVLSLLWRIWPTFPDNIVVFKFANAIFLALGALGVYWFARRRLDLSAAGAVATALVGTLSILTVYLTGLVMSEPLFVALLLPAMLVAERSVESGRLRDALIAGALLGAVGLVRTIGVAALGATAAVLLWRRRTRSAIAVAAVAAFFLVPWQLWVSAHQHELPAVLAAKYGAYGPWMVEGYREGGIDLVTRVAAANLRQMAEFLSYAAVPVTSLWARVAAAAAVTGLLVVGLVVLGKRAPATSLFLAAYLALVVVWPFAPDRFVSAVWAIIVLAVAAVASAVWRWRPRSGIHRAMRLAALAVLAVLTAGHAVYNWRGYEGRWWDSVQRQSAEGARPIIEWIARNTSPTDVLSTEYDLMVYLYTGRRSVPATTYRPHDRVAPAAHDALVGWVDTMLATFRPRYYITGWPPAVEAANVLATRVPPSLRALGTLPHHAVYERLSP
ncbi:MAG TPA: glycosyltransferase family 39 protein [Gemmatimonadaceae bacterium]